jgi:hypothetical protein
MAAIPAAVMVGGTTSVSTALTPAVAPLPASWLVLNTGSVDQVVLDRGMDGTSDRTQGLSADRQCLLSSDESLLAFTGSSPATGTKDVASFASDSIGVAEKKSGTSCYQVGLPGEVLTMALNRANLRGSLGPLTATWALLDVELKQGAQILATMRVGGPSGLVTGYAELRSGASITSPKPTGLPAGTPISVASCNNPADSGPDAGPSDNCLWAISTPPWQGDDDEQNFDTLTLEVLNGAFSVEGGGDGTVTSFSANEGVDQPPAPPTTGYPQGASYWQLADLPDGMIACVDDPNTAADDTVTIVRQLEGDKPRVQVRRLGANADGEACLAVPYTLANGPFEATYYKPLDRQTAAQFIVDLTWRVLVEDDSTGTVTVDGEPVDYAIPAAADLPATTIDFEIPGGPGDVPLGWCRDPLFDGDLLDGVAAPESVSDMEPNLVGTQHACLGSREARSIQVGGVDYYEVHDQVYMQGDAAYRFR